MHSTDTVETIHSQGILNLKCVESGTVQLATFLPSAIIWQNYGQDNHALSLVIYRLTNLETIEH